MKTNKIHLSAFFGGRASWLLAAALLLFGAAIADAQKSTTGWTAIYSGVWYATGSASSPRLERAYAVRVDLENPYVSFTVTGSNGGGANETNLQTTPAFSSANGLEAAINANFYTPSGGTADNQGLVISSGNVVSGGAGRPAQLRITSANVATLVNSTATPAGIHTAVTGDSFPLLGGTPVGDNGTPEPRTGLGLSQDGRYLIMVVIDGRQSGYSMGATILEVGQWLKEFGAWTGINLDGGGSSTLVAQGAMKNSPSGGSPRSVGSNFGVNAAPLGTHIPGANEADNSALVTDVDGNVWFAAVKEDHELFTRRYDASAGVWNSFTSHGTGWSGSAAPALVGEDDGDMWLIAVKSNGTLWSKKWTPGVGWSSFTEQGSGGWAVNAGPSAVRQTSGVITLAAVKQAGQLYHINYTPGSGWGAFEGHGAAWSPHATPCLIPGTDGKLWIFAVQADGNIYHQSWTSSGGWTGYYLDGSGGWSIEAGPTGCARPGGDISWGAVKANGSLYLRHLFSGSWGAFAGHSTTWSAQASPSLVFGDDKMYLFAVNVSGTTYHQTWTSSSSWGSWHQDGAYSDWSVAGGPVATTWADGNLTWIGTKEDGTLYTRHLTGSWEAFYNQGTDWSK